MDEERPIGWWVKRLDTLLEEALDSLEDVNILPDDEYSEDDY